MKNAFVTLLATENFLPGVLALHKSLRVFNKVQDFEVLVTKSISKEIINILESVNCKVRLVAEIENPAIIENDQRGFKCTYTKLRIFELIEYDKVIYLDSDMLICDDITILFQLPHMSAVIAGGEMPENNSWVELNSGLLVIKPSQQLFDRIYSSINNTISKDGSDQGFLQTFYKGWPNDKNLHLEYRFNVPYSYITSYCQCCGFSFSYVKRKLNTNMAVIHYWGSVKPWHFDIRTISRRNKSKQIQAIILWWDLFDAALNEVDDF